MVFSLGDDDMGFRVWRIPEGSFQSHDLATVSPEAVLRCYGAPAKRRAPVWAGDRKDGHETCGRSAVFAALS
jgi:hypothetical protein